MFTLSTFNNLIFIRTSDTYYFKLHLIYFWRRNIEVLLYKHNHDSFITYIYETYTNERIE